MFGTPLDRSEERDRGAAAVEFALVLPLLLLLVFGIFDAGRMLNMQLALTQAAREGVRVAALGGSAADATARAEAAMYPVTGATASLTTACPAVPTAADDAVLDVARTYDYITPIQGILTVMGQPNLATPTIEGRGRMRCNG
jgi:Flp pilus assembly protein TadG